MKVAHGSVTQEKALEFADLIEKQLGEIAIGARKSSKLDLEALIGLVQAARNAYAAPRLSFAIGDIVEHATSGVWRKKSEVPDCDYVVTAVSADTDGLEYAVNGTAWFTSDQLSFVRAATKESIAYAVALSEDE